MLVDIGITRLPMGAQFGAPFVEEKAAKRSPERLSLSHTPGPGDQSCWTMVEVPPAKSRTWKTAPTPAVSATKAFAAFASEPARNINPAFAHGWVGLSESMRDTNSPSPLHFFQA